MKRLHIVPALILACAALARPGGAAVFRPMTTALPGSVPALINYQGRLDQNGNPQNGTVNMVFTIYDALTAGNIVWGPYEVSGGVAVNSGLFNVQLPVPPEALYGGGKGRWLDVQVGPLTGGSVTEMSPREQLNAVPYALVARSLEGTIDVSSGGFVVGGSSAPIPVQTFLFVSSVTGNVGIRTQTPAYALDVQAGDINAANSLREAGATLASKYARFGAVNTWTAAQTFGDQITISTDVYLSAGQINVQGNRITTAAGLLDATQLGGIVSPTNGGTGADLHAQAANGVPYFSATGVIGSVGTGASGYVLQANGAGSAPTWVSAGSVGSAILSSTNTWTAWQSFNNQVTISSDVYLSAGQINVKGNRLTTAGGLLDAAKLANTVPLASLVGITNSQLASGSFPNILGVGALTAGAWTANIISSQYGGTGADIHLSAANGVPYFSAIGVLGTIGTGAAGYVLQANGAGSAPTWVSAGGGGSGSALLASTNTWSAWQTYGNQVTFSTDVYLSAGQINVKGNRITTAAGLLDATKLAGTVPSANISGSYAGVTGVGTLTSLALSNGGASSTILANNTGSGKLIQLQMSSADTFVIDNKGHVDMGNAGATPVLSSCGTGPSLGTGSNDARGTFITGASGTACTITFGQAYAAAPFCIVSGPSSGPFYIITTTALTTSGLTASQTYFYVCFGQ